MTRIAWFIRRWKYTITTLVLVITPSVTMLFFAPTRKWGLTVLASTGISFVSVAMKSRR